MPGNQRQGGKEVAWENPMNFADGVDKRIGTFEYVDRDMIITPFFNSDYCDYLVNAFEKAGFKPGGNYNYDCYLHLIKDGEKVCAGFLEYVVKFIEPEIVKVWTTAVKGRLFAGYPIPFCTKFSPDTKKSLALHNDNSLFTLFIKLNDDYVGCNTIYPRQNWSTAFLKKGHMAVVPGVVTHPHYTEELIQGTKYSLVGRVSILSPRMDEYDDIRKVASR